MSQTMTQPVDTVSSYKQENDCRIKDILSGAVADAVVSAIRCGLSNGQITLILLKKANEIMDCNECSEA